MAGSSSTIIMQRINRLANSLLRLTNFTRQEEAIATTRGLSPMSMVKVGKDSDGNDLFSYPTIKDPTNAKQIGNAKRFSEIQPNFWTLSETRDIPNDLKALIFDIFQDAEVYEAQIQSDFNHGLDCSDLIDEYERILKRLLVVLGNRKIKVETINIDAKGSKKDDELELENVDFGDAG